MAGVVCAMPGCGGGGGGGGEEGGCGDCGGHATSKPIPKACTKCGGTPQCCPRGRTLCIPCVVQNMQKTVRNSLTRTRSSVPQVTLPAVFRPPANPPLPPLSSREPPPPQKSTFIPRPPPQHWSTLLIAPPPPLNIGAPPRRLLRGRCISRHDSPCPRGTRLTQGPQVCPHSRSRGRDYRAGIEPGRGG